MVVIQVKKADGDTFLYETTCGTSNDTLIKELVSPAIIVVSMVVVVITIIIFRDPFFLRCGFGIQGSVWVSLLVVSESLPSMAR